MRPLVPIGVVPALEAQPDCPPSCRIRRRVRAGVLSFRFELPAGPAGEAALDKVEELTVEMAGQAGLEAEPAAFVGVALREAVTNAFRHGCPAGGTARIALHLTAARLVITVRDRGPGFDPDRVPDPCASENLSRGCGRGLFFMRRFTDKVTFLFPRQGGAVVRLAKATRGPGLTSNGGL